MFSKIVFFFSIGAVLAYHLQITPADLQELFQQVDEQVKALEHEAMIEIRDNLIPLEQSIYNAKRGIIQNMTDSAASYWTTIKSLQDNAEAQGQDISDCVDLGNNQLYALNNTIANPAYQAFDYYNQTGHNILTASSTEAYSAVEELLALHEVVNLCNDDTCATELRTTVAEFYQRAKQTIIDAETKPRNYVMVYLPVLLAQYQLDSDSYVANYTVFLNDVTNCISNL